MRYGSDTKQQVVSAVVVVIAVVVVVPVTLFSGHL